MKLTLGKLKLTKKLIYDAISHSAALADVSKKWFLFCKIHTSHVTWLVTSSINLSLSSAILGVSFNFIAYVESEMPGGGVVQRPPPPKNYWHIIKPKIIEGWRYTKSRAPSSFTHSQSIWKWCRWSFGLLRGKWCWEVPCQWSKRYTNTSNRFLEYVLPHR